MKKMKSTMKISKTTLRSIAIICSALLVCVSGWASFKVEGFPFYFVIQNMLCIFFSALWGGTQGAGISGLLLAAGALGAPVFAHGGHGLDYISGDAGGFLLGYFFASMLIGYILKTPKIDEKTSFNKILSACFGGCVLIYVIGIAHYFGVHDLKFNKTAIKVLSLLGFKWYIISDIVKIAIASVGAYFLRPIVAKYFYEEKEI